MHWHTAGASTFGGPCEPDEREGYHSDDLTVLWHSFAELQRNTALGGLPYKTKIRVLNPHTHRRLDIYKRDWGTGGANVEGRVRSIDLYWRVTDYLDPAASCSSWTGLILWRRV